MKAMECWKQPGNPLDNSSAPEPCPHLEIIYFGRVIEEGYTLCPGYSQGSVSSYTASDPFFPGISQGMQNTSLLPADQLSQSVGVPYPHNTCTHLEVMTQYPQQPTTMCHSSSTQQWGPSSSPQQPVGNPTHPRQQPMGNPTHPRQQPMGNPTKSPQQPVGYLYPINPSQHPIGYPYPTNPSQQPIGYLYPTNPSQQPTRYLTNPPQQPSEDQTTSTKNPIYPASFQHNQLRQQLTAAQYKSLIQEQMFYHQAYWQPSSFPGQFLEQPVQGISCLPNSNQQSMQQCLPMVDKQLCLSKGQERPLKQPPCPSQVQERLVEQPSQPLALQRGLPQLIPYPEFQNRTSEQLPRLPFQQQVLGRLSHDPSSTSGGQMWCMDKNVTEKAIQSIISYLQEPVSVEKQLTGGNNEMCQQQQQPSSEILVPISESDVMGDSNGQNQDRGMRLEQASSGEKFERNRRLSSERKQCVASLPDLRQTKQKLRESTKRRGLQHPGKFARLLLSDFPIKDKETSLASSCMYESDSSSLPTPIHMNLTGVSVGSLDGVADINSTLAKNPRYNLNEGHHTLIHTTTSCSNTADINSSAAVICAGNQRPSSVDCSGENSLTIIEPASSILDLPFPVDLAKGKNNHRATSMYIVRRTTSSKDRVSNQRYTVGGKALSWNIKDMRPVTMTNLLTEPMTLHAEHGSLLVEHLPAMNETECFIEEHTSAIQELSSVKKCTSSIIEHKNAIVNYKTVVIEHKPTIMEAGLVVVEPTTTLTEHVTTPGNPQVSDSVLLQGAQSSLQVSQGLLKRIQAKDSSIQPPSMPAKDSSIQPPSMPAKDSSIQPSMQAKYFSIQPTFIRTNIRNIESTFAQRSVSQPHRTSLNPSQSNPECITSHDKGERHVKLNKKLKQHFSKRVCIQDRFSLYVPPELKLFCHLCGITVSGEEAIYHLFFGLIKCTECNCSLKTCADFRNMEVFETPCKEQKTEHKKLVWSSDPIDFVSYHVRKYLMTKNTCASKESSVSTTDIVDAMASFLGKFKALQTYSPWAQALHKCWNYVRNMQATSDLTPRVKMKRLQPFNSNLKNTEYVQDVNLPTSDPGSVGSESCSEELVDSRHLESQSEDLPLSHPYGRGEIEQVVGDEVNEMVNINLTNYHISQPVVSLAAPSSPTTVGDTTNTGNVSSAEQCPSNINKTKLDSMETSRKSPANTHQTTLEHLPNTQNTSLCKMSKKRLFSALNSDSVPEKQVSSPSHSGPVDRDNFLLFSYPRDECPEECPMCYASLCASRCNVNLKTYIIRADCPDCGLQIFIDLDPSNEPPSVSPCNRPCPKSKKMRKLNAI